MTPKATASTFRKRAGMCKATTKVQTVQPLRSVQSISILPRDAGEDKRRGLEQLERVEHFEQLKPL